MTPHNTDQDQTTGAVTLRLKSRTHIPIEADAICPDSFIDRTRDDIAALPVYYGRRKQNLGDLFSVQGEKSDRIIIEGELDHVKKVGYGMTQGTVVIRGNIGQHTGAHMRGGEILVQGDAADKAGINMSGGRLWIKGNAGHLLGAAEPGDKRGVNRGLIVVEGNAGSEAGALMRRGLIVIMGDAGEFTGARMIAGSIFVFGHLGKRAGAGMKRGSIVAFGTCEPLLPTYYYETVYQPVFLRIYLNRLQEWGVPVSPEWAHGVYRRYSGDINMFGKGEILIRDEHECKSL